MIMKKWLKYVFGIVVLLVLGVNSIYFRKLDEMKSASSKFDAKAYARKYFNDRLMPSLSNGVDINQLMGMLQNNREQTFDKYAHALGIGNIRYFLITGQGRVTSVNENDVSVLTTADSNQKSLRIATEFVFGNAIRDASGKIDINEFANTMDFNTVSSEINKIVRTEVLPPFKERVKNGDSIQFAGAIELNKVHLNVEDIEVIPVQLKIIKTGPSIK
jgi:predicted lipoprotein